MDDANINNSRALKNSKNIIEQKHTQSYSENCNDSIYHEKCDNI